MRFRVASIYIDDLGYLDLLQIRIFSEFGGIWQILEPTMAND